MKIGIWKRQFNHTSVSVYTENILKFLDRKGISYYFLSVDHLTIEQDTTLFWDPSCVGGMYPNSFLCDKNIPLFVTVHGVSNMSLPLHESFSTFKEKVLGCKENLKRKIWWKFYQDKIKHVITVSDFSGNEIHKTLSIPTKKISTIYHGFDTSIFYPEATPRNDYFFHISTYSPRKNIDRIIEAYQQINNEIKLPLIIVSKGCSLEVNDKKIKLITNGISSEQLGDYMRNCAAFIFPSLYEGFGMPLAEAMACGVPVITSNSTACKEIVANAGILVNPNEADEIKNALENIANSSDLQVELRNKSLERARIFSWEKCTNQHLEIFTKYSK